MSFNARLISKYIKNNIYRTLLTILGLVVSISMIVFILTSIVSLNKTSFNEMVREEGYQDFSINGVDDSLFKKVLLTKNVSRLSKVNNDKRAVKYYENLNGNEALTNFLIKDVENDYFDYFFKKKLVDGRLPLKEGEAIVPYSLKETVEEFSALDNEISVDSVSSKDFDDFIKDFNFFEGDFSNSNLGKLNEIRKIGFKQFIEKNFSKDKRNYGLEKIRIVGYYSSGVSSMGVLDNDYMKNSGSSEIDYVYGDIIRLNSSFVDKYSVDGLYSRYDMAWDTKSKLEALSGEQGARFINNDSLVLLKDDKMFNSLASFLLTSFLILIIIISIYVFIFNIFTTNFQDKLRDISLLRVVGFTNRQMLHTFFLEGFFYLLVSFPIGYLLGQVLLKSVIDYTQYVFDNSISGLFIKVIYANSIWVFVISFVISTSLIFISQIIAAKNLYKFRPIRSINNIFDYERAEEPKKYQKIIRGLTGYDGYLSIRYAIKDKRKFVITTASITISMVIFIFTTFVIKTFDIQVDKIIEKNEDSYGILESRNVKKTSDFIKDVQKIQGFEAKHNISYAEVSLSDEKGEIQNQSNVLILIDDQTYEENFSEYKDDEKLMITTNPVTDRSITYNSIAIIPKAKDKRVKNSFKSGVNESLKNTTFKLKVVDKSKLEIMTYMKDFEKYDNVLLGRISTFQNLYNKDYKFNDVIELFKYEDSPVFEDQVMSYLVKYPTFKIDSYDLPIVNLLKLYSSGLISVVIFIAILNVFNTTYNNIMTKRREMALIRAVGVEDYRLRKIIINQSIMPVIIASALSLIISSVLIGVIYSIQKNQMGGKIVPMLYPFVIYVLSVLVTFIIVFLTAYIQIKAIEKYNLMKELKRI